MINRTRIGARLFAGFGILVLFSLGYALYSIIQMAKLASITESLYQSPFEVRRAIRDLENDVLKMELIVEQTLSAKVSGERSMLAGRVDSLEADSSTELAVLQGRFLGDRQAIAVIQDSLAKWRSARDHVLSLAVEGDIAGAVSLKMGEYDRLLDVLDSNIQYVKAFSAAKAQAFYEDSLAIRNRTISLSIAIMLALTAAGTAVALQMGLSIRKPIEQLIAAIEKIAAGDLGSEVKVEGSDEIAKLGATFLGMQEDLRRKAELARRIAGGDFSARLEPKGPADELGKALSAMVLSLHEASITMARSVWVREGRNGANEATRGDLSSEEYSRRALEFVATYARACVGALCAASDGNGELELLAGYAFAPSESRGLRIGEGLAGQAAASGELTSADDLPEDYLAVSSMVGESRPRSVVALPLMSAESASLSAIGVVELGFTSRPAEDVFDFLRSVAPGLSAGLASALARERMKLLLDESRSQTECLARQAELLARQEEELRQGNEELEQQAEELRCSEEELLAQREELLAQREELRTANEKLEDAGSALRGKARDLEEASRYKSVFLANMSHELRTPLNSILILSQLIAEDGPGSRDKRFEYARSINAAGNDLLALISDILDLSKIEAGKVDLCFDNVNLLELILEIKAQFSPIAEKKGIGFRVEAADSLPPSIVTDRGRLSQILKNLVSNAIKFSERGEVVVMLGSSGSSAAAPRASCGSDASIRISVRDSGIGVSDDKKEAIFSAFQQAESSTTRKYGGTGLGLTIARELARLLNGDIELQSAVGQGSIFTLVIPTNHDGAAGGANARSAAVVRQPRDAMPATAMPGPAAGDAGSGGRKRLLIIEDDGRQLEAITELLSSPDLEIDGTKSGIEALELIAATHFDCVIMDLGLTGVSGLALARRVRANLPPGSSIIVYSGRELEGSAKRELASLADRVISKGARSPVRLMKALDALLGRGREDAPKSGDCLDDQGRSRLAGRKVLLVDDDERNLFAMRCALEERGVEVVVGTNGREGLTKLVLDPDFDLVLLDIMMPEMDGYAAMAEIRGNPATWNLPIIALTANALPLDRERCFAAGADDCLSKPINIERLLSVMEQWAR